MKKIGSFWILNVRIYEHLNAILKFYYTIEDFLAHALIVTILQIPSEEFTNARESNHSHEIPERVIVKADNYYQWDQYWGKYKLKDLEHWPVQEQKYTKKQNYKRVKIDRDTN